MTDQPNEIQVQDTEVRDIAEEITGTLAEAFEVLIQRRESAFAAAIAPLQAEQTALAEESASIEEARVVSNGCFPPRRGYRQPKPTGSQWPVTTKEPKRSSQRRKRQRTRPSQ